MDCDGYSFEYLEGFHSFYKNYYKLNEPNQTCPNPTKPDLIKPNLTETNQTKPDITKLKLTKPDHHLTKPSLT